MSNRELWNVRQELTVTENGILSRGSPIVMPQVLQDKAISLAHNGYQWITKTK